MTEQNELENERVVSQEAAELKASAGTKQAMNKIEKDLSNYWDEQRLDLLETQFEEFAESAWHTGICIIAYNRAISHARKLGFVIKNPLPISGYETHSDPAHDDYRLELYSREHELLMTIIFRQTSKAKVPFKLKDFYLYKQGE